MKGKNFSKQLIVFIVFFVCFRCYSFDINTRGGDIQVSDSLFIKEYMLLNKLFDKKEYEIVLSKSLKYYERIKNRVDINIDQKSSFLLLIGDVLNRTHNYSEALVYYKKSLSLFYVDIEKKYNSNDFFSNALYAKSILKVGAIFQKTQQKDSAIYYYTKLNKFDSNNDDVLDVQAASYTNLSGIYQQDSIYDKAQFLAMKAVEIQVKRKDKYKEASALNNLGSLYLREGKFVKAKQIYKRGINLIKSDSSANSMRRKGSLYFNLAWAMRNLKDYKAYDYQELSYDIKDELKNVEIRTTVNRINSEFNLEIAEKNIRQEEELKRQKVEQNSWIIGLSGLTVIVFLIFMLNQNRLRQKNLSLELSQKETESQIQVLNANLKGQETERKRISQELHDGILSKLFGSRIGLGYLELDSDKETQSQYQKYLEELQNIEKEIREVSHKLSSDISLSETSLLNAINQLLKEKSKLGDFDFQLKMDDAFSWKELDGVLEMNLFRILQESLQNVIKHAKAKNVNVSFGAKGNVLVVAIEDDGVGFDTGKKSKGIGLKNIRSRIEKLKGTMSVSSETGKGTVLELKIPLV